MYIDIINKHLTREILPLADQRNRHQWLLLSEWRSPVVGHDGFLMPTLECTCQRTTGH